MKTYEKTMCYREDRIYLQKEGSSKKFTPRKQDFYMS